LAVLAAAEEEEKMEKMHLHLVRGSHKHALMALSVLDFSISSSDADERIVEVMDELQNFVSKVYKNTLKQRSFKLYFRKQ
jgi:hypothetical protein